ncbi:MAG: class I SAM-dependent methyltransferase [Planctomycetaceae bacterium]|nr:class I SAM-dependent methyltransferase [Planctomycetaceae bacterium]
MIPRTLEPEVMDSEQEAREYDEMDHVGVNDVFVSDFLKACPEQALRDDAQILDVGTGTALIPIEFCRQSPIGNLVAIDLAAEMLKRAAANLETAGMTERVQLKKCDAKRLPFQEQSFAAVMSNSIIHHIPEPIESLREMVRVLKPGGLLFVRDLMRPESVKDLETIVEQQASEETEYSRQLFRQSLHAALTVDEVQKMLEEFHLPPSCVSATTERHWTISAFCP